MLPIAPPPLEDEPAVGTDALCRRALAAYDALAASQRYNDEPDLGVAIHLASGRRALDARLHARSWVVPPETAAAALSVISSLPRDGRGAPVIEWLETFPARFLAVIDRRRTPTIPEVGGRRAWDRVAFPDVREPARR
jgi:hypothetical protein